MTTMGLVLRRFLYAAAIVERTLRRCKKDRRPYYLHKTAQAKSGKKVVVVATKAPPYLTGPAINAVGFERSDSINSNQRK